MIRRRDNPGRPHVRSEGEALPGIIAAAKATGDQQAAALMAEPEQEQGMAVGAVVTPLQLYDVVQYHVYQTVTQLP
jgi:hypothetical protein